MKNRYLVLLSLFVIFLFFVFTFGLSETLYYLQSFLIWVFTIAMIWYLTVMHSSWPFEKLHFEMEFSRFASWVACVGIWLISSVFLTWYFQLIGLFFEDIKNLEILSGIGIVLACLVSGIGIFMSTILALFGKNK